MYATSARSRWLGAGSASLRGSSEPYDQVCGLATLACPRALPRSWGESCRLEIQATHNSKRLRYRRCKRPTYSALLLVRVLAAGLDGMGVSLYGCTGCTAFYGNSSFSFDNSIVSSIPSRQQPSDLFDNSSWCFFFRTCCARLALYIRKPDNQG